MNRVDFVIRQLRYYASIKCLHTIYIGDSSSKKESEKIQDEINRLGNTINVKYYYLPNHNIWQAHYRLTTEVKEKYTCLSGDDDYQIPDSITKCAEFLEANPEYTTASGHAISFRLKQNGVYGELLRLADYKRGQIENDTGAKRIMNFFNNYYVTFFSVNRTKQTMEYWKSSEKIPDQAFGSEILPNSLSLIHGKSKILDCLGFVRQIHGQYNGLLNSFDWMMGKDWNLSFEIFTKILTEKIAVADNIGINEADQIVKQVSWKYLAKRLSRGYAEIYEEPSSVSGGVVFYLKKVRLLAGKKLPWLKNLYRQKIRPLTKALPQIHDEVLRGGSKYFGDFKPVIDSFTGHNSV
jgi:glycosyltransferase domain-containing protein